MAEEESAAEGNGSGFQRWILNPLTMAIEVFLIISVVRNFGNDGEFEIILL
jgi:hypothetical protein